MVCPFTDLYLGLDLREPDVELLLVVQRAQPLLVVGDLGELEEEPVGLVELLANHDLPNW